MNTNSIPYLGYVNIKSTESVVTQVENKSGLIARTRKTKLSVYEINNADISNMRKLKLPFIDLLLSEMQTSAKKDLLRYFIASHKKDNTVVDTLETKISCNSMLAAMFKTTTRTINRALKSLVESSVIKKLNKYQIMLNPYYIVHNHMAIGKIEELQVWWDSSPKEPIKWLETEDVDGVMLKDLSKIESNIKQRQEEAREVAMIKATNDANDIAIIDKAIPTLTSMCKYHKKQPKELELSHIRNFIAKKHKELALTSLEPIKVLLVQHSIHMNGGLVEY